MNTHTHTHGYAPTLTLTHPLSRTQSHRHRRIESHCFRKYHKIYFDSQSKSQLPFGPTVGRFCFCIAFASHLLLSAPDSGPKSCPLTRNVSPLVPLVQFVRRGPWSAPNRSNRDQLVLECFRLYLVVDLKIQKRPRSHKSRGRQCVQLSIPFRSIPFRPCRHLSTRVAYVRPLTLNDKPMLMAIPPWPRSHTHTYTVRKFV